MIDIAVRRAEIATQVLYNITPAKVKSTDLIEALKGDPRLKSHPTAEAFNTTVAKMAVTHGLVSSNCQYMILRLRNSYSLYNPIAAARQLIASKGLYLNNAAVLDIHQKLTKDDWLGGECVILKAGSQRQIVVALSA